MTKSADRDSKSAGKIYIGVGGWTFAPWRGVFYPEKLTQAKELEYAASKLTSIEINGTYYGSQKPESFRKWAREVPDGFVFSVKGPRFATNRRVLAEAGDSIKRFYDSGVLELGDRLGPVLWQFAPTKKFDEADFGKFLELLPRKLEGRALRHVVEVRHDSFCVPEFIALIRQLETPDRLRGRMSGVNMVFFIGGPQLGEFEAGAVANWLGAPFSVVSGGIGCLVATLWVALTTPALRHYHSSRHVRVEADAPTSI